MPGPNMAKKAKKANTKSKRRGVANRSPVEKAARLAKFAVTNPKTFTEFYVWGGDSVWNADKGRRSPNMLGGMVRAERQQTKRQEKRQFNRTMNTNKTGMSNTPETRFEASAPPSAQGKARAGTGRKRNRPGIENR